MNSRKRWKNMVVNHNMAAIGQSRQLRYNVKKMEDSSKKLSSGYKIISANDDCRFGEFNSDISCLGRI